MTTVGRSSVSGSGLPSSAALRRGVVRHIYSSQGVIEYVSLEGEAADAGENVDDDDAGNEAVPNSSGRPPKVTSPAASESVVVGARPRRSSTASSSSSSSSSSDVSTRSSPRAPAARPRSRRSSFAHLASRLMPTIQEDEELKIVLPPVNVNPNHRVSSPLPSSPTSPPPQATMSLPPGYPLPQGQAASAAPRVAGRAPPGYYEELERMQSEFWRQGNAVQQHQQQQQNELYQQRQQRQQQQYHLLLQQQQRRQQQQVFQQQQVYQHQHGINIHNTNMLPRAHDSLPSLPTASSSSNLARGFTMAPPQRIQGYAHAGYAGYHAPTATTAAAPPQNHFMNPNFNRNPIFINSHNTNHNFTRPSTTSTTSSSSSTTLTNNMNINPNPMNPTTNRHPTTATTVPARPFDPDAPLPPGMRGPPIVSPMVPFYTHLEALALLRRRFEREQLRREGREDREELVDVRDRGLW